MDQQPSAAEEMQKFEAELQELAGTYAFLNMLRLNEFLGRYYKENPTNVLLAFHALMLVSNDIFDSPLVLGGYVRQIVENPREAHHAVVAARADWGPSDFFDEDLEERHAQTKTRLTPVKHN